MKRATSSQTITLTLVGNTTHLVGFGGFSAQQVRKFAPHRAPGAGCLVGGFHRQPPMGVPTAIALRPDCRALLVAGRAFERAHDCFVPLQHAPGEVVRVELLAPPPAGDLARLTQLVRAAEWVEAVTYRDTYPHEYSRRASWRDDADFVWATTLIARVGYRSLFNSSWWTQLDCDGYTYWTGFQPPHTFHWINRRPLDRAAVPVDVKQTLVAENARRLEIDEAADPHFALGVALFGAPLFAAEGALEHTS